MKNWSKKFNELSLEHRKIGLAHEAQLRVQHLEMEKTRLKRRYEQSLKEINSHIKNCKETLEKLEMELTK
jgi:ABC-type phosphate transport system auxiliary subunit